MSYPYLYPGECPALDDIREAMAEHRPMGADTRSGLVGWWPGRHRGANVLDFSGRAKHGTWSGTGSRWAVDAERQGIVPLFGGSDEWVDVPNLTPYSSAQPHTYMAWVRHTGPTAVNYQWVINNGGANVTVGGDSLVIRYTGGIYRIAFFYGGGANVVSDTTYSVTPATWHHIATSYDGAGNLTFFCDGAQGDTSAVPAWIVGNTNPRLGAWYNGTWDFYGRMDDPRVYSRALSAPEIRYVYDCGRVAPLSDLVEPVGWETVGAGGVVVPWHLFGRVA